MVRYYETDAIIPAGVGTPVPIWIQLVLQLMMLFLPIVIPLVIFLCYVFLGEKE
jgi:hypothetical protein